MTPAHDLDRDASAALDRAPYGIDGPACIAFSGGRTSGYLLRRILDEGLRPDVHVLFANTGKEREETLAFVHECEQRWAAPIRWLEFRAEEPYVVEVTFATASRAGEPFRAAIDRKGGAGTGYLPNPVTRFCTIDLKIRPMGRWMKAQGYDHWSNALGIRADEPRRAAKARAPQRNRWENLLPLVEAHVTKADVDAFWQQQPFGLALEPHEGNCDLCFLKGQAKKLRVIRDEPSRADWWIEQEQRTNATFRIDQPSYASMKAAVAAQPLLLEEDDTLTDCYCGGAE